MHTPRGLSTASLVDQLHDACDVECREEENEKVVKVLEDEFTTPVTIGGRKYVFPVEVKIGKTWDQL